MSALDGPPGDRLRARPSTSDRHRTGPSPSERVTAPLSMLSFWAAIALPVFYLPLLASGIDTLSGLALFLCLFGLHVLALVGGRPYAGRAGA